MKFTLFSLFIILLASCSPADTTGKRTQWEYAILDYSGKNVRLTLAGNSKEGTEAEIYKAITKSDPTGPLTPVELLNPLGREGWEVSNMTPTGFGIYFLLKRPR